MATRNLHDVHCRIPHLSNWARKKGHLVTSLLITMVPLSRYVTVALSGLAVVTTVAGFTSIGNKLHPTHQTLPSTTTLFASYRGPASTPGRSSPRNYAGKERSKRQERVGHLVRTELSQILHRGTIKGELDGYLEDALRQRISLVNCDISPDLRQARISVSIRNDKSGGAGASDAAVDKRRAYSWLVRNSFALKHTLAQRMSHMKSCPNLTFVQVDVAAAVDVMYLIDKVNSGYKRESIDEYIARGDYDDEYDDDDEFYNDDDEDEDEDDDDWEEEDDGFFKP